MSWIIIGLIVMIFIIVVAIEMAVENQEEDRKCYYRMERKGKAKRDTCSGAGDIYERRKCCCNNCEYYKRWIAEAKK